MGRSRAVRRTVDVGCRCRIVRLLSACRNPKRQKRRTVLRYHTFENRRDEVARNRRKRGLSASIHPRQIRIGFIGLRIELRTAARFQRTGIFFDARRKTRCRSTIPQRTNYRQSIFGRHLHGREREDFSIQLSDGRHNCLPLQSCHTNDGRHSETQTRNNSHRRIHRSPLHLCRY